MWDTIVYKMKHVYVSINKLEKKFYISVDSVQRKWKQNYMVWFHLGTNKTNHSVFFIWECVLAYVCMNEGKYAHHPVTVGLDICVVEWGLRANKGGGQWA